MVRGLAELGFTTRSDIAHDLVDPNIEAPQFFGEAEAVLHQLGAVVVKDVIPGLDKFNGTWHPLGFMVYALGTNIGLGTLRLHIWPQGERDVSARGPRIHDHGWFLSSLVLRGTYRDDLYRVTDTSTRQSNRRLPRKGSVLRVYNAIYANNGPDSLKTDGRLVDVQVEQSRAIEEGNTHRLSPGEFHLPSIPEDELVATLVIDSPSLDIRPSVLFDGAPTTITERRRPVNESQAVSAKFQFANSV